MKVKKSQMLMLSVIIAILPTSAMAAPRPDFYQNSYLKKVGAEQARNDAAICGAEAEDYLNEDNQKTGVVREAARGAARGAAKGALAGAIINDKAGRGAGAGAALGGIRAAGKNARDEREGSPEYRKYVEACLEDKGYKVIGWK